MGRIFNIKYNRWFGIHNPFGSRLGKAKDPYINAYTLKRLLRNAATSKIAAENVLQRKSRGETLSGEHKLIRRNLELFKTILFGDFDQQTKGKVAFILATQTITGSTGEIAEIVFQADLDKEYKELFIRELAEKVIGGSFIDRSSGYEDFFVWLSNQSLEIVDEVYQQWIKFKPSIFGFFKQANAVQILTNTVGRIKDNLNRLGDMSIMPNNKEIYYLKAYEISIDGERYIFVLDNETAGAYKKTPLQESIKPQAKPVVSSSILPVINALLNKEPISLDQSINDELQGLYDTESDKILRSNPDAPSAKIWFHVGSLLAQQKENEKAVFAYTKGVALSPQNTDGWLYLGYTLRELELLDLAVSIYQKTLTINPNHKNALNNLSEAFDKLGRDDESLAVLEKAVEADPHYAMTHLNIGRFYIKRGEINNALLSFRLTILLDPENQHAPLNINSLFNTLLKIEGSMRGIYNVGAKPESPDANRAASLYVDGLIKFAHGKFEEALESFETLSSNIGIFDLHHFDIARTLFELGRLEQANLAMIQFLELYKDFDEGWNYLGLSFFLLRRRKDAILAISKGIEIKATFDAYYNRGMAHLWLKQYDEAIADFHACLKLKPDLAEAWYKIGWVLTQQGKMQEAVVAFDEALKNESRHADALYEKGNIFNEQGKKQQAESYFKAAERSRDKLSIHDRFPGLMVDRFTGRASKDVLNEFTGDQLTHNGAFYAMNGFIESSFILIKKATEVDPNNSMGWYNLGASYEKSENLIDAEVAYRKATETDPANSAAWFNLAVVCAKSENYAEAASSLRKVVLIESENQKAWEYLAESLLRTDQPEKSLEAINKAIELDQNPVRSWELKGIALERLGRQEEADKCYRQAEYLKSIN